MLAARVYQTVEPRGAWNPAYNNQALILLCQHVVKPDMWWAQEEAELRRQYS
jgi:hypothetical protein